MKLPVNFGTLVTKVAADVFDTGLSLATPKLGTLSCLGGDEGFCADPMAMLMADAAIARCLQDG